MKRLNSLMLIMVMLIAVPSVLGGVVTTDLTDLGLQEGKVCTGNAFICFFTNFFTQAQLNVPGSVTQQQCQDFAGQCGLVNSWNPPYVYFGTDLKWTGSKCVGTVYTTSEPLYQANCDPSSGGGGGGTPPDECPNGWARQCTIPGFAPNYLRCQKGSQGNYEWQNNGDSCSGGLVCFTDSGSSTGISCKAGGGGNSCTSSNDCADYEVCSQNVGASGCQPLKCPSGQIAQNHQCVPDNSNVECNVNTDCEDNNACTSNLCQSNDCNFPQITSGSCSPTTGCGDGYCDSATEDSNTCSDDCASSTPPITGCQSDSDCDDGNSGTEDICDFLSSGNTCSNIATGDVKCGDGVCSKQTESINTCPSDCTPGQGPPPPGGDPVVVSDPVVVPLIGSVCKALNNGVPCSDDDIKQTKTLLWVVAGGLILIIGTLIIVRSKKR